MRAGASKPALGQASTGHWTGEHHIIKTAGSGTIDKVHQLHQANPDERIHALAVISSIVTTVLSGRQACSRRRPLPMLLTLAIEFPMHRAVTDAFSEAGRTVETACRGKVCRVGKVGCVRAANQGWMDSPRGIICRSLLARLYCGST